MIERLEKISTELFKNALKTYTIKQVLTHKRAHAINAPEMLNMYPNKGVGFHLRKKNWSPGLYYQIKRADYKSHRNGVFYGIKYLRGDPQPVAKEDYPHRLQGLNKRGIWTYQLGNFKSYKTDNGLKYTRAQYQAFLKVRGVGITQQAAIKEKSQNQENELASPQSIQTQ